VSDGVPRSRGRRRLSGAGKRSCTHCGVLKIVKTVVCEDEPPPLPGFYSSPCGANSQRQRGSAREERERERERKEHRSTGSSSGQADRCMGRQTGDGSTGLLLPTTLIRHALAITTAA